MSDLDQATSPNFRIGVFADGPIGDAVVQFMLSHHPLDLRLLITKSGDVSKQLRQEIAVKKHKNFLHFKASELDNVQITSQMRALELDVVLLAWWPFILRNDLYDIARIATLNMHPSYLPFGRGKDPNFWALIEESIFGVSIHHVTSKIDAGDIAFQKEIPVTWEDTGQTLYQKAQDSMLALFIENYDNICRLRIPRTPQDNGIGSYHSRAELDPQSKIELNATYKARELLNLLRARTFRPHPACYFFDNGKKYEARIVISRIED